MAKMTGARFLAEILAGYGVTHNFMVPAVLRRTMAELERRTGIVSIHTHGEQPAAYMADGYARSTGKPGVLCVVPGPGVTNSLSGLGEAFLDSVPLVCIVGDVARGEKYRPFQVHDLPQTNLLKQVNRITYRTIRCINN